MSVADHIWHPWLRIQRVLRVVLKTQWNRWEAGGEAVTPAMEAGITDHVWSAEEITRLAE